MKLRIICGILVLMMLAVPLASCQNGEQPEESGSLGEDVSDVGESEYNVEAENYGGRDFIILGSTVSEEGGRHFSEFGGDLQGNNLSAAIYKRDNAIMTKHNVKLVTRTTTSWNTEFNESHISGELTFHVATPGVSNAVYSVSQGSIACLNDYPVFDFDRPWWQREAMNQMQICGKDYFAIGDINLLAYDSVGVVFYNKDMATKYQFSDLQNHVKDGTWDYETFFQYVSKVTANTNGDSLYGAGDTFGYAGASYSALCFTYAGNYCFVEKDVDGIPAMKEDVSDFVTFFQKLVSDHSNTALVGYALEDEHIFEEDRLLFSINMLGYSSDYRNAGKNYGILPLPKWNTDQEKYYTFPHQSASTTICIPSVNTEYDMTSRIIEDLAYHSYKDVLSHYIETNLFRKSLDGDIDSYNSVKTVLSNLNCDIFFSYRAGITQMLRDCLDNMNPNIASQFKKYEKSIKKQLSDIATGVM